MSSTASTLSRSTSAHEWDEAVSYFRDRGGVVFLSYCRFWERHGFVQQSLARRLVAEDIPVLWLDGAGWRRYRPSYPKGIKGLSVRQLPELPGRRFLALAELSIELQLRWLKRHLKGWARDPVVWIQAGIDERLAGSLPSVDVFSVFDDPYRHTPIGDLCRKASLITCQNSHSFGSYSQHLGDKVEQLLPPLELSPDLEDSVVLPENFPKKRMGYVGSYFSSGYDLVLFENFIRSFPDWGFVLIGRTDAHGKAYVERFKAYPNFFHHEWLSKTQAESAWKLLDICLLFYRPNRTQDGAFPVKFIEASRCGVPTIATAVPKTADLPAWVPKSPFADELKKAVGEVPQISPTMIRESFEMLSQRSDPKHHLIRVAKALKGKTAR